MKKAVKRAATILLVIAQILFLTGLPIYAEANDAGGINKNMLEAMLKNRPWVIDTLIYDDYSSNPHAIVSGISGDRTLMNKVLDQYQNENDPNYSAAYETMVDALTVWYNKGDYAADIADCVTEWAADVIEFFGGESSTTSTLRNCADSAKNMKYDNILQEVIKADYTASNGQTLRGSDSELVLLRKINDGASSLSKLASAAKSFGGLDSKAAETASAYTDSVLIPAAKAYEDVIRVSGDFAGSPTDNDTQAAINLVKVMALAEMYDSHVLSSEIGGDTIITLAPSYLLDENTLDIIDFNADFAKWGSVSLDSYMYIRSIQTQKESVAGVMRRTTAFTPAATDTVLNRYAGLIEDAADGKTAKYDWVVTTLRNKGVVSGIAEKKVSDVIKSVRNRCIPCYDETILPAAFASVTGVIGTATFLADATTGIKDTCTKTLELKNTKQLLSYFRQTYQSDMAAYLANRTDENAAKVIDDLDFIQRIVLRGEKVAYSMYKNQLHTWVGKLIAGTSEDGLDSYYAYDYQRHIDAVLGASVIPFTTDGFTVRNGESIMLSERGGIPCVSYSKNNETYYFAEPEYRFAGGIEVSSGGSVLLTSGVPVPYITNNGGTVLAASGTKMVEYTQNSGSTTFGGGTFDFDDFEILGGTVSSPQGCSISGIKGRLNNTVIDGIPLSFVRLECGGSVSVSSLAADVLSQQSGTLTIGGNVTCGDAYFGGSVTQTGQTFRISGDLSGGSGTVSLGNVEFVGILPQTVFKAVTVRGFKNNNRKILNVSAPITVTQTADKSGNINHSENVVLTGTATAVSDTWLCDFSADNWSVVQPTALVGKVDLKNGLFIDGASLTLDNNLTVSNGNINLSNGASLIAKKQLTVNKGNISLSNGASLIAKKQLTVNRGNISLTNQSQLNTFGSMSVYDSDSISIDASSHAELCGMKISKTSGTYTIDGDVTVNGDVYFEGNVTQNGQTFRLSGDLSGGSGTVSLGNVEFFGKLPQNVNKAVTVSGFANLNPKYVNAASAVTVTQTAGGTGKVKNGRNVTLTGNAHLTGGTWKGDITVNGLTLTQPTVIDGTVYSQGSLLLDGVPLTVKRELINSSGSVSVTNGALLKVSGKTEISGSSSDHLTVDAASTASFDSLAIIKSIGGVTCDGTLVFGSDALLTSTSLDGGGCIRLAGDLIGSSLKVNRPGRFVLDGRLAQHITASGANFDDLVIDNPSKRGVVFEAAVNCCGTYQTGGHRVSGTVNEIQEG